jgi:hypothetical protein
MGESSPRTMHSIGEHATALCRQGKQAEAQILFDEFTAEAPAVLARARPSH